MTEPIDLATPAAEDGGPAATDSPAPAPRGSWAALMPALLLVALVAATAVGAVALQRRESGPYGAAPQIGWMHQGCARWAASSGMGDDAGSQWCSSMASWMRDRMSQTTTDQGPMGQMGQMGKGAMGQGQMGQGQMGQGQMGQGQMGQGQMGQGAMGQGPMGQGPMGQGQMTGSMMWQSPETMQAACEEWATSGRAPTVSDARARCAQMVTWMTQHMGDWSRWMTDGPMMMPSTTR